MTSVAILGNDTVLAARPATAVQLAHACVRMGFEAAIPGSWGDELVATESVRQLAPRGDGSAILCACPHVESALLAPGADLAPLLVPVVAPPVAAARYLRYLYGDRPLRITYVGRCPSASADASIDVQLSPEDFLRELEERGVSLVEQPTVFDSVIPPDRRRFCSLPGGAPSPSSLWDGERTRTLIEIESDDYKAELAQRLIAHRRGVIDLAPRLGCACSGAAGPAAYASARAAVLATEPPRAAGPVVEAPPELELSRRLPTTVPAAMTPAPSPRPAPRESVREVARETVREPSRETPSEVPRRSPAPPPGDSPVARGGDPPSSRHPAEPALPPGRAKKTTPSGIFRAYTGHVPTTRSAEGRPLPRAYAAHRKSPTSSRAIGAEPPDSSGAVGSTAPDAPPLPNAAAAPPEALAGRAPTADEPASNATTAAAEAPRPPAPPREPEPRSAAAVVRGGAGELRRSAIGEPPRRRPPAITLVLGGLVLAAAAVAAIAIWQTRAAGEPLAVAGAPSSTADPLVTSHVVPGDIAPPSATDGAGMDAAGAPASAPVSGTATATPALDSTVPPSSVGTAPLTTAGAPASGHRHRTTRRPAPTRADPPPAGIAPAPPPPSSELMSGSSVFRVVPRSARIPARPDTPGMSMEERDSIQREIAVRRARVDSIQRRLDSLKLRQP